MLVHSYGYVFYTDMFWLDQMFTKSYVIAANKIRFYSLSSIYI